MSMGAGAVITPLVPLEKQKNLPRIYPAAPVELNVDQDAVSVLTNLGYGRSEAFSAVITVKQKSNDNPKLEELIKLALKELAS